MRYSKIILNDIANGVGLRTTLFVTGCTFQCEGCFNKEYWDFKSGQEYTNITKEGILVLSERPEIKGLSILGGEPLHLNNVGYVYDLMVDFKEKYPTKDIWVWTGFTYEELVKRNYESIIELIDVLVDGRFENDKKDLSLKFRGSSNQRVIDVKKTLASGEVTLWCD